MPPVFPLSRGSPQLACPDKRAVMKPQRPATRASARGTPSLSMSDPDVKDSDPLAWAELSSEATSEYAAGIAPPLDAATLTAAEVIKLKSIVSASSATRRTPSPTPLYARLNWTSGRQGDNFVAEPPTLYAQVAQAIEDREETRQRQDGATPLFARLKWSSENRSSSTLKPPAILARSTASSRSSERLDDPLRHNLSRRYQSCARRAQSWSHRRREGIGGGVPGSTGRR